jgi:general L-amino acid transport system permease protein
MVAESGHIRRHGPPKTAFWRDREKRAVLFQILAVGIVVLIGWYLVSNTMTNLAERRIATGFSFLGRESGFGISESPIPFGPADSYFYALLVGLLNTLKVAIIGIVLATLLGTVVGIARLSTNWLIRKLSSAYVETLRNTPLLLQLFLWYSLITVSLPGPREAFKPMPGIFLSNRGLRYPELNLTQVHWWMLALFAVGCGLVWWWRRRARDHQMATGQLKPILLPSLGFLFGPALVLFVLAGAPFDLEVPELRGFNFVGGGTFSPELTALLFGLVVYTSSFIAEIVRGGILAVPGGQTEAARALGLPATRILRLVILPQALRVIIPPVTSQYLNLAKNSSLAVAIGFPDLVSIANTTINQTGQAIEGILLLMMVYLTISLGISLFMNWYNARIALNER